MKEGPDVDNLDIILRSSALVAGGFMGTDARSVTEVIDADAGTLYHLGVSEAQMAARMKEITRKAAGALSTWVKVGQNVEAMVDDVRGSIPCPWPHEGYYPKRVTTVQRTDTGQILRWSDLNIHMVGAHGFFEGKGSPFRIEPADLVRILL